MILVKNAVWRKCSQLYGELYTDAVRCFVQINYLSIQILRKCLNSISDYCFLYITVNIVIAYSIPSVFKTVD